MAENNNRRETRQLQAVWEAVKDATSHPTADQIYDQVRSVLPNISLGTVYRNLQKLVAEGKLQVVTLGRAQRFDPTTESHEHFICERCGQVYDIFSEDKNRLLPPSLPHPISTVTSYRLELYGHCLSCSE